MKPKYYKWSGWYVKVLSKRGEYRRCLSVFTKGAIEIHDLGDQFWNDTDVVVMEETSSFEFNRVLNKVFAKIEKAVMK